MCCLRADVVMTKNHAAIFVVFPDFIDHFWQTNLSLIVIRSLKGIVVICPVRHKETSNYFLGKAL